VKTLRESNVTIVGLGLMGGSLAGALRGRCRHITGVDVDMETRDLATKRELVDGSTAELAEGTEDADIVVLAMPVRTILRLLDEIGALLKPGTVLIDLGSTKAEIMTQMADLPHHVVPLGAHPMCGKEQSGIAVADPALYQDATFILTPLAPERQDMLTATVSHLPYLLACALVATADATTSSDPAAWEIVAGGFRDTSRVAGSDVTMMLDILLTNRDHVLRSLSTCIDQLEGLSALIAKGDEATLRATLAGIRTQRKEMFP
jgi:prephenate dehydrogenase